MWTLCRVIGELNGTIVAWSSNNVTAKDLLHLTVVRSRGFLKSVGVLPSRVRFLNGLVFTGRFVSRRVVWRLDSLHIVFCLNTAS